MDPREHWRTVYGTRAAEEVSWYQAVPQPSLEAFDRLGVTPGMAIVDVGAGAATLADALLDRGFTDVTLLDIADTALQASRLRLGPARRRFIGKWRTFVIGIRPASSTSGTTAPSSIS